MPVKWQLNCFSKRRAGERGQTWPLWEIDVTPEVSFESCKCHTQFTNDLPKNSLSSQTCFKNTPTHTRHCAALSSQLDTLLDGVSVPVQIYLTPSCCEHKMNKTRPELISHCPASPETNISARGPSPNCHLIGF